MEPSSEELLETIAKIEERLKEPGMELVKNESVKYGYIKAIELLKRRETNYNLGKFDLPRGKLVTLQMRSIAVLACDYCKGEVKQKTLVSIPLKE